MSSQSNPNFSEEDARARAAEGAFPPGGRSERVTPSRDRSHGRANPIAHHREQTHEVHGGRTAARQQNTTDSSRGRGRAVPPVLAETGAMTPWAAEVLYQDNNYGQIKSGEHPDTIAARLDPRKATPLPPDHPEVMKEIKFDRISRLMQPGSNDEIDQELGLDSDDDWIS